MIPIPPVEKPSPASSSSESAGHFITTAIGFQIITQQRPTSDPGHGFGQSTVLAVKRKASADGNVRRFWYTFKLALQGSDIWR
jgi:hypothetical protein